MDAQLFWKLIQQTKRASHGEIAQQVEALTQKLEQLSADDIIAFERLFIQFMDESYRADLWGAAYLINGGCSDDGFDYFRGWLIAQGERAFAAAIHDPQTLTSIAEPEEAECEEMLYVARNAYGRKTGKDDFNDQLRSTASYQLKGDLSSWAQGGDEETRLKQIFPKLYRKFVGNDA